MNGTQAVESEALLKDSKDVLNVARKLAQKWDNGLNFPPSNIPERYLRGDLAIRVEGSAKSGNLSFGKIGFSVEHEPQAGFRAVRCNTERCLGEYEFAMLVRCIELVNNPQGISTRSGQEKSGVTLVRLQHLDDCAGLWRYSLYFSLVFTKFRFLNGLAQVDRKLDPPGISCPLLGGGEFPGDVIQAGAQVVNDLSNQDAKTKWDNSVYMRFNRFFEESRFLLGDNWVRPLFKERRDFSFEVQDVLIGPF